jgi:F0F1-type ATP synthase membrane subunit b/b'
MQPPDLSLLVIVGLFWATFFVLKKSLFGPLGTILEERDAERESATTALAAALERQRLALAELDAQVTAARREAMEKRELAKAEAGKRRDGVLEAARAQAQAAVADAQKRLDADIAATRAELRTNVAATAGEIASLALGRKVA